MSLKSAKVDSEWVIETRKGLYEGHEVKQELVVGPIVLQPQDLAYQLNDQTTLHIQQTVAPALGTNEMVRLTPGNMRYNDDQSPPIDSPLSNTGTQNSQTTPCTNGTPRTPACIKEEPQADDELLLVADLGPDEMVRLGLTPETLGADYDKYQKNIAADIKKEVERSPVIENHQITHAGIPVSHVDAVVKEELLKDDVSVCDNGLHRRSQRITNKQKAEAGKKEYTKFSRNLTFETDSEDCDTDSDYEEKDLIHEDSDSNDKKIKSNSNGKKSKSKVLRPNSEDCDTDSECEEKDLIHEDSDSNDRKVKSKSNIQKSKSKVTRPKKRHICEFCNKEFSFRAGLTNHVRIHTGEKPYSCNICCKKFSDCAVLVRHKRMHSGDKPHECDVCGKRYSEKYLLKNHKLIHTGEMKYFCKFCPKKFVNSSNYRRHQNVHNHKFICDICKKPFPKKDTLISHIVNHMKIKPYICKYCKKGFGYSGHLNRHMELHTNKKEKYRCNNCEQGFTQNVSLKRHIERNVCKKFLKK